MRSTRSYTSSVALGLLATVALATPAARADESTRLQVQHVQPGAVTPTAAYSDVRRTEVVVPSSQGPMGGYSFADGCWYRSLVSGSVRDAGRLKQPDLTVTASVHCGTGVTTNRPRVIRSGPMNEGALEGAVADAATVRTFNNGTLCVYRPVTDQIAVTVQVRRVERECGSVAGARGGGPRGAGGEAVVREEFARDLENGCEYRARVRGRAPGEDAALLRVNTSLHCPGRSAVRSSERTVTADRHQVAARLERAGTIDVRNNGEQCTYTPKFGLNEGRPEGRSVSYVCRNERTGAVAQGGVYIDRSQVPAEDPSRMEGDVLGEVSVDQSESMILDR